jgi:hypothetical protein
MSPDTRAMIVWLLETHSVVVVHAMMRGNPSTEPIARSVIRALRVSMLRDGASPHKKGVHRPLTSTVIAMIKAMLEKGTPAQVFETLSANLTGEAISLNDIKLVRRDMLAAGAQRSEKRGPKAQFTAQELVERRRIQQRDRWQAIRANMPKPVFVPTNVCDYEAGNLLIKATEAMFARKAERLGCSVEAARLVTLYSRAQLEQRLAA